MIRWKDLSSLHVISKLEHILAKWFSVEQIFADSHYKIMSGHLDKDYHFSNPFMKMQMQMPHGYTLFSQDVERVTDQFANQESMVCTYDSYFKNVMGVCAKIVHEGEVLGSVFAYPFISDTTTEEDLKGIVSQMVESGASQADAELAVSKLKKMSARDLEYLSELVELVSEEVLDFHREISTREERISELNSELGEK